MSSDRKSTVSGIKDLNKNLKAMTAKLEKQQKQALKIEAERIMTDSKKNYVPVDEGTLRNSGVVSDPIKSEEGVISITLGYGGAAAPYATALHEFPSESSPPTWEGKTLSFTKPGTGPKYLERPLMKSVEGMTERLAEKIKLD